MVILDQAEVLWDYEARVDFFNAKTKGSKIILKDTCQHSLYIKKDVFPFSFSVEVWEFLD